MTTNQPVTSTFAGQRPEAATGIEPVYRALQAPDYRPLTRTFAAISGCRDHIVTTLVAAAAVLALAACSVDKADTQPTTAVSGVDTESGNTDNPPPADVTLDRCGADEVGWIEAAGTITNHSSKPSTYFIEVEFLDPAGVRYGEGITSSSTVAPGQQAEWNASGLTDARGGGTCKLISVDRYEA